MNEISQNNESPCMAGEQARDKYDFSLLLIPALILLAVAMILRYKNIEYFQVDYMPFYLVETRQFSAHFMDIDTPYISEAIGYHFKNLAPKFLKDYLFPSFGILLPSVILFALGAAGAGERFRSSLEKSLKEKNDRIRAGLAWLLVFAASLSFFIYTYFYTPPENYPMGLFPKGPPLRFTWQGFC